MTPRTIITDPATNTRGQLHARATILLLSAGSVLFGCLATPRIEDAPAPRDYLRQSAGPKRSCDALVEVVRSAGEVRRPYREIATLSASCYPGMPKVCEDRLTERACELKADAVILMPSVAGGTPPGASTQSEVSMSGRAVVWKDHEPAAAEQ